MTRFLLITHGVKDFAREDRRHNQEEAEDDATEEETALNDPESVRLKVMTLLGVALHKL